MNEYWLYNIFPWRKKTFVMAENRVGVQIWNTVNCGMVHKPMERYEAPTILLKMKLCKSKWGPIYSCPDLGNQLW